MVEFKQETLLVLIKIVEDFLHFTFTALQILKLGLQPVKLERLFDDFCLNLLLLDLLLLSA